MDTDSFKISKQINSLWPHLDKVNQKTWLRYGDQLSNWVELCPPWQDMLQQYGLMVINQSVTTTLGDYMTKRGSMVYLQNLLYGSDEERDRAHVLMEWIRIL